MTMTLYTVLLLVTLAAALWAAMARSLLKSAIALAATSAALSILLFTLDSPLAAVFELSVCSGLITVIFMSTISLTKPLTIKEAALMTQARRRRFLYLPIIIAVAGVALFLFPPHQDVTSVTVVSAADVRSVLWNTRQMDLFGQILVIITGAFGIAVLFKEARRNDR